MDIGLQDLNSGSHLNSGRPSIHTNAPAFDARADSESFIFLHQGDLKGLELPLSEVCELDSAHSISFLFMRITTSIYSTSSPSNVLPSVMTRFVAAMTSSQKPWAPLVPILQLEARACPEDSHTFRRHGSSYTAYRCLVPKGALRLRKDGTVRRTLFTFGTSIR